MQSSFSWLDYSEKDRRRMMDVISAFREQDTRDELGIGSIRDGFADLLFPGTGTVQTRARYFLFTAWHYQGLEQRKVSSRDIAQKARQREIALIKTLEDAGETRGNIGREAREHLQRLPSNIYWLGLGAWGIRIFQGTQDQYHRYLDTWYAAKGLTLRSDDHDIVAGSIPPNWHPGLPEPPSDFPDTASFDLRSAEARYLQERILARCPESLLAHLVATTKTGDEAAFCWLDPRYPAFTRTNKEQVDHARTFSLVIHGAALLYNLILAEIGQREELVDQYTDNMKQWAVGIEAASKDLAQWDRERFWEILDAAGASVSPRTRGFVDAWVNLVLAARPVAAMLFSASARELIRERERTLKRGLARIGNPRALELWTGAAGTRQLDYRWGVASQMLTDITRGLKNA